MLVMRLLAICFLLSGAVRIGATDSAIPGGVVRIEVLDSQSDYELRAAALSPSSPLTEFIMAAWPKGQQSGSVSLVWATVDASGRVLSKQNPLGTLSASDAASINLRDPAAGSGFVSLRGRSFLLLPTVDGGISLVRLARSNEPTLVRAVKIAGRSPIIRRVSPKDNEHLVVVGSVRSQPLVAEVDTDGKTIAEHVLPEEGVTAINAVFEPEGTAVVVGERGVFPSMTVWLGRMLPGGEVTTKKSFPGRPLDIARGSDGTYLVVIEQPGENGSEILMKALGPDLSERWTRSLMSHQHTSIHFRVASISTGGFTVAGTKDRGLWISRVKSDGSIAWTEAHNPLSSSELEMTSRVEMATTQDIFIVAYTAFVVIGREQREMVRALRFRATVSASSSSRNNANGVTDSPSPRERTVTSKDCDGRDVICGMLRRHCNVES